MEHTIELTFGYEDKKGVVHRDVVLGKRPTVADMIVLDNDPRAQLPTQYGDLTHTKVITKFGDLKTPVSLDVLLSLNSIDREDLDQGVQQFMAKSREDGGESEFCDNGDVKLRFGFAIDDTTYTTVTIGKLNTGRDEVDADRQNLGFGIARMSFLLGRRITKLATDDGSVTLDGPVDLKQFHDLDGEDLQLLRIGGQMQELTFRIAGKGSVGNGNAEGGDSSEQAHGNDGAADPRPAAVADQKLPEGNKRAKSAK